MTETTAPPSAKTTATPTAEPSIATNAPEPEKSWANYVQVRNNERLDSNLKLLEDRLGKSKTVIVNDAVSLFTDIVSASERGGNVRIEYEDGSRDRLLIVGLQPATRSR